MSSPTLSRESRTSRADLGLSITRIGTLMTPDVDDPREAEGVLNPATAHSPEGELLLYPRLVGVGNRSRVGIARVEIEEGVPARVEREGVVIAPDQSWERGHNHGGTEDPRITTIPALGLHVMTYVAVGPMGPRSALAVSEDARNWRRLGPIQFAFEEYLEADLNLYPNKDVLWFPEPVTGPDGHPAFAMLHRPMWDFSFVSLTEPAPLPKGTDDRRAGIWISYVPVTEALAEPSALTRPRAHQTLALPVQEWENLKIGGGPAPFRTEEGWVLLYHGVSGVRSGGEFGGSSEIEHSIRYSVGAMILAIDDPRHILARTSEPLMEPATDQERDGTVPDVVFPTAVETIDGVRYVFYGMADTRIGLARLDGI